MDNPFSSHPVERQMSLLFINPITQTLTLYITSHCSHTYFILYCPTCLYHLPTQSVSQSHQGHPTYQPTIVYSVSHASYLSVLWWPMIYWYLLIWCQSSAPWGAEYHGMSRKLDGSWAPMYRTTLTKWQLFLMTLMASYAEHLISHKLLLGLISSKIAGIANCIRCL